MGGRLGGTAHKDIEIIFNSRFFIYSGSHLFLLHHPRQLFLNLEHFLGSVLSTGSNGERHHVFLCVLSGGILVNIVGDVAPVFLRVSEGGDWSLFEAFQLLGDNPELRGVQELVVQL